MSPEEAKIVAFERELWRQRDWPPAIASFLSRWLFLPLMRLRDDARGKGRLRRYLVGLVFYPTYVSAMFVFGIMSVLLLLAAPALFCLARLFGGKAAA